MRYPVRYIQFLLTRQLELILTNFEGIIFMVLQLSKIGPQLRVETSGFFVYLYWSLADLVKFGMKIAIGKKIVHAKN